MITRKTDWSYYIPLIIIESKIQYTEDGDTEHNSL